MGSGALSQLRDAVVMETDRAPDDEYGHENDSDDREVAERFEAAPRRSPGPVPDHTDGRPAKRTDIGMLDEDPGHVQQREGQGVKRGCAPSPAPQRRDTDDERHRRTNTRAHDAEEAGTQAEPITLIHLAVVVREDQLHEAETERCHISYGEPPDDVRLTRAEENEHGCGGRCDPGANARTPHHDAQKGSSYEVER